LLKAPPHRKVKAVRQEARVPVRRRPQQAEAAVVVGSAATQDHLRPQPAPRI
jgi:hypothetical protein